jgi:putative tricarboxylic transport membrane protein
LQWVFLDFQKSCVTLADTESREVVKGSIGSLLPSRQLLWRCLGPILRGTGLGSVLGILPGNGAVLAPFASYSLEKKLATKAAGFGRGSVKVWRGLKQQIMPARKHHLSLY